MLDAA